MASRKPAEPTPDPNGFVRVRDALTGHEYTTVHSVAVAEPDRYTVLDKPATWQGVPLPPKPRILTSPPHTSDDESAGAADQAADIPVTA